MSADLHPEMQSKRALSESPGSRWSHILRPDIWRESQLTIHQDDDRLVQNSSKFCSLLFAVKYQNMKPAGENVSRFCFY